MAKKYNACTIGTMRGEYWHVDGRCLKNSDVATATAFYANTDRMAVLAELTKNRLLNKFDEIKMKAEKNKKWLHVIPNGYLLPFSDPEDSSVAQAIGIINWWKKRFNKSNCNIFGSISGFLFKPKAEGFLELIHWWGNNAPKEALLIAAGKDGQFNTLNINNDWVYENVYYLGEISDVKGFMKSIDWFISHSYLDAQPGTVTESLTSGTPVIITDTGGNGGIEFVNNNLTGYIIKSLNDINKIDLSKDMLCKMKEECYKIDDTIETTWYEAATKYDCLFQDMIFTQKGKYKDEQ
jgi:glycosyltransferase involved in cell wall biosynthesis